MSYRRGPPDTAGMVSLKVDNLSYRTSSDDLRRAFEKYGDVGDVYIPRDRFTRESRGFAFVRFYDKRDAEDAMDNMDSSVFDGRELRVQTARYGRPDTRRGPPRRYGGGGFGGGRDRDRDWGGGRHSSRYRSRSRSRSRSHSRRSRSGSRKRSRRSSTRSQSESRSKSRSRSRSPSRHRSYSKSKSKSPRKEDD